MRFVASGNFLFAVAVFFLPWLDVRCEMAGQRLIIFEQSGQEAAAGKVSEGADIRNMRQMAEQMNPGGMNGAAPKNELFPVGENKEEVKAPILYVWIGLVGGGALLCLIVPGRTGWRAAAILCTVGAVAAIGYQTAVGFPIERELNKKMEEEEAKAKEAKNKVQGMPDFKMPKFIVVHYLPGFYLAWGLSVLPILWVCLDAVFAPPQQRRRERNLDDDDYDSRNPFDDD